MRHYKLYWGLFVGILFDGLFRQATYLIDKYPNSNIYPQMDIAGTIGGSIMLWGISGVFLFITISIVEIILNTFKKKI